MTASAELPARPVQPFAKELVKSTGFLLARLGIGFKAQAMAEVERAGSDLHDRGVLALLAEGTPQTQVTIADALNLDPSRLVALLDSLEGRGLIVRRRDPKDRRRHLVSITPSGKRDLAKLREVLKKLEDEFFGPLDADERKALHELLLKLACATDPRCAFAAGRPS
jgi:DNA-binding MarR family transcriptional regulator